MHSHCGRSNNALEVVIALIVVLTSRTTMELKATIQHILMREPIMDSGTGNPWIRIQFRLRR